MYLSVNETYQFIDGKLLTIDQVLRKQDYEDKLKANTPFNRFVKKLEAEFTEKEIELLWKNWEVPKD